MLNDRPDLRVVLAASGIRPEQLRELKPRVVLIDVGLQERSSLELAKTVTAEGANADVIVMDLFPAHEEVSQFVKAGVAGFVMKDATFDDLVTTVRSVATGERVLPAAMTDTLFTQIAEVGVQQPEEALHSRLQIAAYAHEHDDKP